MSRCCELTGKSVMSGNNVSHANNRTRRRFLPNLQKASMTSEALGRVLHFRVAASAIRTVEKRGGIDAFLRSAKDDSLSVAARKAKKEIIAAK